MTNLKQFFSPFNLFFSFLATPSKGIKQQDKCVLSTKVQTRKKLTKDAVQIEVYSPTELDANGNPMKSSFSPFFQTIKESAHE